MAESPNHWFAVHASLVWELKVGTRGRYIDKGRGQEIKFGREEEGRRSEGGRQQECESLDQICPSSLSDPATGLLMRLGTRPITRAQCTQHCTTLLHWRNAQHVQHWRNASQHQTTSDQQAVVTSVPEYKSVTTLLHGGARGKK